MVSGRREAVEFEFAHRSVDHPWTPCGEERREYPHAVGGAAAPRADEIAKREDGSVSQVVVGPLCEAVEKLQGLRRPVPEWDQEQADGAPRWRE